MAKRLTKSATDRKFSGVCGGVAEYLGIDSTIVRLVVFGLMWYYGTGLMLYVAASLILPEPQSNNNQRNDYYGDKYDKKTGRRDVTPDE